MAVRPAVQSHASGPDFDADANSPPVADASTVSLPRPYPRTLTRTSSSFVVASTFTTWPGVSSRTSLLGITQCCWMGQPVLSGWRLWPQKALSFAVGGFGYYSCAVLRVLALDGQRLEGLKLRCAS